MQRIGLFGGSFDPVHLGHLLVAQAAREELELNRLFFIPAAQSPFKPERQPTPAKERLRLLRLALAGRDWCEIDEQEIRRGGISYTIETVRDYAGRFPEAQLFYLVGADHVPQLPKWREAQELARLAQFVIIPRPQRGEEASSSGTAGSGGPHPAAAEAQRSSSARTNPQSRAELEICAPAQVERVQLPAPFRGRMLAGFPLGISSSQVRARIKAGLPLEPLVPAAVAEAIRNNRLYL